MRGGSYISHPFLLRCLLTRPGTAPGFGTWVQVGGRPPAGQIQLSQTRRATCTRQVCSAADTAAPLCTHSPCTQGTWWHLCVPAVPKEPALVHTQTSPGALQFSWPAPPIFVSCSLAPDLKYYTCPGGKQPGARATSAPNSSPCTSNIPTPQFLR